jgi:hypothetical protein
MFIMSTSPLPISNKQVVNTARETAIDWRFPFWTVTLALVFAGAVSLLRMVFAGPAIWAEGFAFIGMLCWRYWAHATGLFPWRISTANRFKFAPLPQTVLNGFAWFVFYSVLLTGDGRPPTTSNWVVASLTAIVCAVLIAEPISSDAIHRD